MGERQNQQIELRSCSSPARSDESDTPSNRAERVFVLVDLGLVSGPSPYLTTGAGVTSAPFNTTAQPVRTKSRTFSPRLRGRTAPRPTGSMESRAHEFIR